MRALSLRLSLLAVSSASLAVAVFAACSSDSSDSSTSGTDSGGGADTSVAADTGTVEDTGVTGDATSDATSANDAAPLVDAAVDSGGYDPVACQTFFSSVDPSIQVPYTLNSAGQRASLVDAGGGVRKETGKYVATWAPSGWYTLPNRTLIIDLHGTAGYPEAEWSDYRTYLQQRNWAFLGISYLYNANNDAGDYDSASGIYSRITTALTELRAACGTNITLHLMGFSRGSANTFTIALLDRQAAGKINGVIANAGAWPPDGGPLPPDLQTANSNPMSMKDTRFWGWCGLSDLTHGYPMCDEMTTALKWVQDHGGTVAPGYPYKSPDSGHVDLRSNPDAVDAGFTWINSLPPR